MIARRGLVKRATIAAAMLLAALCAGGRDRAGAETYPSRPVTIVLPFGPGTVTDMTTRLLADHLQRALGQPVLVENKAGASGTVGAAAVARAQPDGYTLLFTTSTTHSVVNALLKSVPYDPIADFTPIGRIATLPSMLVVNNDLPVKTIEDLVAYGRDNPGRLEYGFGNASGQIAGEMVKNKAGIAMTSVPYRSNPQALTDLLAGTIKVMVVDLGTGLPQAQAGKLRPIAMLTANRSSLLPELPTLAETLVPGFDVAAWAGVFAPAGAPQPIVARLAQELQRFVALDEVRQKLAASGTETHWMGPAEFPGFLKAEIPRWTAMAQEAGIKPQ
jgi:tripartite-type tricarboxylate transporter receptor subunit TctC